jgi:transcriptional regulator with XRE-family HTH domain
MQTQLPRALRAFGLNVRRHREASGLTQEGAGEKADLDPTYISGIERGVRNPSLLSICRLAKALGVSVSELVDGVRE